ncbi:MAG: hypothetical protein HY033_09410 [Ignavibacteriae bacterium]|nr:hypothetical protein [Ignavibacteria bacterium]MBI3365110.1 hypothetical protein [Ignavibacteriota bacterium]
MHILLVDPTDQSRTLLHRSLAEGGTDEHSITVLRPKSRREELTDAAGIADVVLFGVRVTEKSIVRITTTIRTIGSAVPIFVLTQKSESGITQKFKKAGVDDMLTVAELDTPLIAWTFMSSLKQAEVKKKATEFDMLRGRIKDINNTLAYITHEINNPLSIIRLAMYHLENVELTPARRQSLFKIISDNLDKVHSQTEELRSVRRDLGNGALLPNTRTSSKKDHQLRMQHHQ